LRISIVSLFKLLVLCGLSFAAAAQNRFEVASIKQHDPKDTAFAPPNCNGDRFIVRGVPILSVLMWAYDLRLDQYGTLEASLPTWARVMFYDIEGVAGRSLSEPQCKLLVQDLFGDRFKMTFHWKTVKNSPAYELSVGPKGHKLVPAADADQGCGVHISPAGRERPCDRYQWPLALKRAITMPELAQVLSNYSGDPLFDHTGLVGEFKIKELSFAVRPNDPTYPSLQTALQEQLGLVMRPTRRDLDVLIVDSIERPTPN